MVGTQPGGVFGMYTEVRAAIGARSVDDMITRFVSSTRPVEIETLAVRLGASGNHDAVRPLLESLCDEKVQREPHVEQAVCEALVALDVMSPSGDESYALRPHHLLDADVSETVSDLDAALPLRYLIGRPATS